MFYATITKLRYIALVFGILIICPYHVDILFFNPPEHYTGQVNGIYESEPHSIQSIPLWKSLWTITTLNYHQVSWNGEGTTQVRVSSTFYHFYAKSNIDEKEAVLIGKPNCITSYIICIFIPLLLLGYAYIKMGGCFTEVYQGLMLLHGLFFYEYMPVNAIILPWCYVILYTILTLSNHPNLYRLSCICLINYIFVNLALYNTPNWLSTNFVLLFYLSLNLFVSFMLLPSIKSKVAIYSTILLISNLVLLAIVKLS